MTHMSAPPPFLFEVYCSAEFPEGGKCAEQTHVRGVPINWLHAKLGRMVELGNANVAGDYRIYQVDINNNGFSLEPWLCPSCRAPLYRRGVR